MKLRSIAVLLLLLLLLPLQGQVVITGPRRMPSAPALRIVQILYCDPGVTCPMPSNVTAGNIMLFWSFNNDFCCDLDIPSGTNNCVSPGTPWTRLQFYIASNFMGVEEDYCPVIVSGPETITILGRSTTKYIVLEITGQAAVSPIDAAPAIVVAPSTSASVSSSVTTTVSGDLLISFMAYEYGNTDTTTNAGWTWVTGTGVINAPRPINSFKQSATSPGTYSVTFTNSNSAQARNFVGATVAIKPH
jgi:hypothetical protein